jgi:hypothetical protein
MKKIYTLLLATVISLSLFSQTSIPNGGFETWTGSGFTMEPTNFNSNRTGTGFATLGGQTCFQDASIVHSGSYSARVETITAIGSAVNGSLTSGIVNAPTTNKADGYIGTMQGSSGTDIRRISFVGRPDSLIGFYRYVQSTSTSGTGGVNEQGKVRAILHVGNFYDPETPATSYHPDSSANKIANALFLTPMANVSVWTRFSVPFTYYDTRTPQYIMINVTPSNNQLTSVAGSKIWLDDISVVYNPTVGVSSLGKDNLLVYNNSNILYVDSKDNSDIVSELNVYDLTGKIVLSKSLSQEKSFTINLSELTKGMYLYQLSGKDFTKSGKIIIE